MHIGRISAMLTPGDFVLDDVRIEGLTPDARPFFAAKRIYVHVPWWTMFRLKLDIEVDITDWTMAVESWEGGRHSLPNLKFGDGSPRKKSWYTTTVRFAYAKRGQFYYRDHATPWTVDAPNLEFSLVRAYSLNQYVGARELQQRAHPDSAVPADGHRHVDALRAQRWQRPSQASRSDHRWECVAHHR